jgi:hypothetical protein
MPEGGLPSLEDIMEGKISPAEMALIKETLEDVEFMQEGYNLDRPGQAMGGIMEIERDQAFVGGLKKAVSSIAKGIGSLGKKAVDVVGDTVKDFDFKDAAQAFVMSGGNPYAATFAGTSGDEKIGFNPFSFTSGGPGTGQPFSLAPMPGQLPTGQGGGILDGIDPDLLKAGMKIGTNILQNKAKEKQEEKNVENATNFLKANTNPDKIERAIKLYGGAAVSAALAKLAYESQQQQLEDFKRDREAFEQRREVKRAEYDAARRPAVTGAPTGPADVVRRPGQAMGGIMDVPLRTNPQGVTEMDFRETGGFVPPVGIKEKADDIPAMLSNNEFVFTADAVRAAGGGSVNKGAERMYSLMKKLEGQA